MKKKNTKNGKWFDVTITESYYHTYKIFAKDEEEADNIANELVNEGTIDPTEDGGDNYDREVFVEDGKKPNDGEDCFSNDDVEM